MVSADLKSATTHTFDSALAANATIKMPTMVTGECQAWIHVSESLLNQVNVIVTAFDPEGTVTFDTQDINPTPSADGSADGSRRRGRQRARSSST